MKTRKDKSTPEPAGDEVQIAREAKRVVIALCILAAVIFGTGLLARWVFFR